MNDELLNELGAAWDLPPKASENFKHVRLDPLRMKARLLVEGFDSSDVWGWKDPRNSLRCRFGGPFARAENTHHGAQSIGGRSLDEGAKRNFLFVWFAALGNLQPARDRGSKQTRATRYSLRFVFRKCGIGVTSNCEFIGLPDAQVASAAALVTKRRRHTHSQLTN